MKHKVVDVEPFKKTYVVSNKTTGDLCGDFSCVIDAVRFAEHQPKRNARQKPISFTLKLEADDSHRDFIGSYMGYNVPREYVLITYPAAQWVILGSDGTVVSEEEVSNAKRETRKVYYDSRSSYYETRDERCNMLDERLVYKKGSSDKIKQHFAMRVRKWHGWRGLLTDYTNDIIGNYRRVNTMSERRINSAICDDYGTHLVRGRRRGRNLPSSYDDVHCGYYEKRKSWKNHSKRRKQWKMK